jgi:uncharacterized membrane protein YeaQ/YmgE (transglycosylase-associated protein family)
MPLALWLIVALLAMLVALKMTGGLAGLVSTLLIGGIAGWLAGHYMRGRGFGIVMNVLVGIVGAAVGGILFRLLGLYSAGFIGSVVTATIGAIVLLSAVRWLRTS